MPRQIMDNIFTFFIVKLKSYYDNLWKRSTTKAVLKRIQIFAAMVYGFAGGFGITAGSHRLFAHKAYKANRAMKIMLLYFQTIAFQNSVYEWARDHR